MSWLQVNNAAFKIKILDYTYTSEPEVNTALPLKRSSFKLGLFVIACVLSLGFFWLLAKWSDKRQAIFLFVVCSLEEATHMLIEEEDDDGSTIVPKISKYDMREARVCLGFEYRDRTYLYSRIKEVFSPIRYVELGKHLD